MPVVICSGGILAALRFVKPRPEETIGVLDVKGALCVFAKMGIMLVVVEFSEDGLDPLGVVCRPVPTLVAEEFRHGGVAVTRKESPVLP